MVKGFQKRFFVLDNETLSYFKDDKNSITERGQISLRVARVDPMPTNTKKIIIYTGTTEMHLKFANEQEKREWVQSINEA